MDLVNCRFIAALSIFMRFSQICFSAVTTFLLWAIDLRFHPTMTTRFQLSINKSTESEQNSGMKHRRRLPAAQHLQCGFKSESDNQVVRLTFHSHQRPIAPVRQRDHSSWDRSAPRQIASGQMLASGVTHRRKRRRRQWSCSHLHRGSARLTTWKPSTLRSHLAKISDAHSRLRSHAMDFPFAQIFPEQLPLRSDQHR